VNSSKHSLETFEVEILAQPSILEALSSESFNGVRELRILGDLMPACVSEYFVPGTETIDSWQGRTNTDAA
jgi:hypothetical protein